MAAPTRAWVRSVSDSYADCLRDSAASIDVALAREQHAGYVRALEALGIAVTTVEADHGAPDCCFIEDAAVLWPGGGMVTRMAPACRARETEAVAAALAELSLPRMETPATLDGGDVLRVGDRLFVGRSARSNDAGIEALRRAAVGLTVLPVEMSEGLHLKSSATLLDGDHVLAYGEGIDRAPFIAAGLRIVEVPEFHGANVLAFGDTVIVSAAAPRTAELIETRGKRTVTLDVSEFHKGDGALSCLSLRRYA